MNTQELIALLKDSNIGKWTVSQSFCDLKVQSVIENPNYNTVLSLKEYLEREDNENEQVCELIEALAGVLQGMPKPEVVSVKPMPNPSTPAIPVSTYIAESSNAAEVASAQILPLPGPVSSETTIAPAAVVATTESPADGKGPNSLIDMVHSANTSAIQPEDNAEKIPAFTDGSIFWIEPTAEIKVHPYANLMPLPSESHFKVFKANIEEMGQTTPVDMYNGQVINGRNRIRACQELGIPIKARNWHGKEEELLFYVIGQNRSVGLTSAQKAAAAVNLLPELERQALKRKARPEKFSGSEKGDARDIAARLIGSNPKSVSDLKKIKAENPDIFQKVFDGKLSVHKALKDAFPSEQETFAPDIKTILAEALNKVPDAEQEWFSANADLKGGIGKIFQQRLNRIGHQLIDTHIDDMRRAG